MKQGPAPKRAPAVLAVSGSSRPGSYNRRLLDLAVEAVLAAGAEVSLLDLRDLDLPVYDPAVTLDEMPAGVLAVRQILAAHDGLLVVTPEYNGSLPPLLVNTLDWSACPAFGERRLAPYRGRLAAIMSASLDAGGGICGLDHLRAMLSRMGAFVVPEALSVPSAVSAFDGDGLRDAKDRDRLRREIGQLVAALRLSCPPDT